MSDSGNHLDVSKHMAWQDEQTGEGGYSVEHMKVEDGTTRITFDDISSLIPADVIESNDRQHAVWELRKMVARKNREAKLRAIPEARRRAVYRETSEKQRRLLLPATTAVCPFCTNTGWVDDLGDGTAGECQHCNAGNQ